MALRDFGAGEQVATLLARDPASRANLDRPDDVARLLETLRGVRAEEQAMTLIDRLPREGLFDLFSKQIGHAMRYRFGREPDGSRAPSWDWDDLD